MGRATSPEAVPYLLLGETRRQRLKDRLGALVDGWYRTWAAQTAAEPLAELSTESGNRELTARGDHSGDSEVFAALRGEGTLLQASVPGDFLRILSGVGPSADVSTQGVSPMGRKRRKEAWQHS